MIVNLDLLVPLLLGDNGTAGRIVWLMVAILDLSLPTLFSESCGFGDCSTDAGSKLMLPLLPESPAYAVFSDMEEAKKSN